ncbi:hypothetical protein [uncultured Pontibacter sp.]|uniref:hypothetical protein n=1 Tax=uncultured Pontibacter sp. TaxID=453356 RepID=UPI00262C5EE9|nr:hypothetical protein [uncultured Pontibacter sp.]
MKTLKTTLLSLTASSFFLFTPALAQNAAYKGLPLLKANASNVNVRIGNAFVKGLWTIKPEYTPNALRIQVSDQKEKVIFYTDIDSAAFDVRPDRSDKFYVLLNKQHYVLAEVKGFTLEDEINVQPENKLLNIDKPRSKTFGALWEKHHIGEVVNDINNYADKASGALNWVKEKVF